MKKEVVTGGLMVVGGAALVTAGVIGFKLIRNKINEAKLNDIQDEEDVPDWYSELNDGQRLEVLRDFCGSFYDYQDKSPAHRLMYLIPKVGNESKKDDMDKCRLNAINEMMDHFSTTITGILKGGKSIDELLEIEVISMVEIFYGNIDEFLEKLTVEE